MTLVIACSLAWTLGVRARNPESVSLGSAPCGRGCPPEPTPCVIRSWQRVEGLPKPIAVFDTVFWEPEDTASLRKMLASRSSLRGKRVLEIGTGTGLLSLCCLQAGATEVVATEINPAAVSNAVHNARLLGLADRLEVRRVPLHRPGAFSVVGRSEKFDLIVSNPPWENGRPQSIDKYAHFDPGFQLLHSLLEGLEEHLNPGGVAVVAYGSVDAISTLERLAPQFGLQARAWDRRSLQGLPSVFLPGMLIEIAPVGSEPLNHL